MTIRLKETLTDKQDIEIEMLQIQKNYVRAKNEAKKLKEHIESGANDIAEPGMTLDDKQRLANAYK